MTEANVGRPASAKLHGIILLALAAVSLAAAAVVPIAVPVLAAAGAVRSFTWARRYAVPFAWLSFALFLLAVGVSLTVDFGLLAATSGTNPPRPAAPLQ